MGPVLICSGCHVPSSIARAGSKHDGCPKSGVFAVPGGETVLEYAARQKGAGKTLLPAARDQAAPRVVHQEKSPPWPERITEFTGLRTAMILAEGDMFGDQYRARWARRAAAFGEYIKASGYAGSQALYPERSPALPAPYVGMLVRYAGYGDEIGRVTAIHGELLSIHFGSEQYFNHCTYGRSVLPVLPVPGMPVRYIGETMRGLPNGQLAKVTQVATDGSFGIVWGQRGLDESAFWVDADKFGILVLPLEFETQEAFHA